MADVSLGSGSPLSLGSAEPPGPPGPPGPSGPDDDDGYEAGAVGVGTGGESQAHSRFVGFVVRIGLTFPIGAGCARPGVAGVSVVPAAPVVPGSTVPAARGVFPGPPPIPEFGAKLAVTAGCGGKVSAAAGFSLSSDPSPFTTPRYAPAAPTTVSTPSAVTAAARRGTLAVRAAARSPARAAPCSPAGAPTGASRLDEGSSKSACPPNVFIPVEVTSGPRDGGSTGRRPRS